MVIGKCVKCGKKYQLTSNLFLDKFECECGSNLTQMYKRDNKPKTRKKESSLEKADKKNKYLFNCPYCGHKISKKAKSCPNCGKEINPDDAPEELRKPKKSEDLIIAISATLNVSLILYFLLGNLAYIFGLFTTIIFISMYTEGKWKFKNTNNSS